MTVSTLTRRSFFEKFKQPRPVQIKTMFGTAKPLHLHHVQEMPVTAPPPKPMTIAGGLDPYTGPWAWEQAAHLLRRTTFGLKKADVDLLLAMNMEQAVDYILNVPTDPPSPPINDYNNADYTDPVVPDGEIWVEADYDENGEGYRIESFRGWWLNLMVNQGANIQEKMTLFWHNHFATQSAAVFYGKPNYQHNTKLRAYALGNFKELTKVVTLDPMMLYFLNGNLNSAAAPDENYARELQELFTVGKDNPDHYTEEDVFAAARVLTGWRVNPLPNETFFYPIDHDTSDKQFSAYYGNTTIQGGTNGDAELDALLDMIFDKNEVSEYLCRKLYRWFVYYNITPQVEQDIIQPLAELFRNSNYDIKPVLETLLKSEHFFEATNTGCFIKTPVDIVIGTLRSFNLTIPASTLYDGFVMQYVLGVLLAQMQMLPGDPPNVAGWQAFRQSPQYYRMWINGDTSRNRNFYTDVLTVFALETDNDALKVDHIAFASQFSNPENPNDLIDEVTRLLLPQPLSTQKKVLLKSILLSGLPNDSYWTLAWLNYVNDPTNQMNFEAVNIRLTILHKYVTSLPEYQLS